MRKILIVEDNQINRDMLSRRLERKGYQVFMAVNGLEGVSQATTHQPDVILMDMSMPVMDGWEATRRLKANPQTRPIPIIALTAHAMVGDRERAVEAGCDEYEMKPVDLSRLLIKIEAVLEKASAANTPTTRILTLLLVDDNKMNREVLGRRLKRPEYRILEAKTGKEAIETIEKETVDLMLLDSMMPEMSGLEVLKTIREKHSVLDLPVIMVTAKEQTEDVVGALEAGANDYVTKPLNFPVVLARVQTQLAFKRVHQGGGKTTTSTSSPVIVLPSTAPVSGTVKAATTTRLTTPGNVVPPAAKATPTPVIPPPLPRSTVRPKSGGGGGIVWKPGRRDSQGSVFDKPAGGIPARPVDTTADKLTVSSSEETRVGDSNTWIGRPPSGSAVRPKLSGYEVLGELGRGGMGIVYKARHQAMNRMVAIKVIDKSYLNNPDAIRRFYREVRAAAHLSHPNIVLAYDAGESEGSHYFVMEYIDGVELGKLIKDHGPLTVAEACHCIRQIARGLQHAHEQGLVHRDIKPSNLLATWTNSPVSANQIRSQAPNLTDSGEPISVGRATLKILDMGLALFHQPTELTEATASGLTLNDRVVGTADYMAPEQWTNARTVDIRADLYSLGCTFYFLLTGRAPFSDNELPMEKMLKHHLDEPAPITDFRDDVPDHVVEVVRRLMAKKPADRFQTPEELHDALSRSSSDLRSVVTR